MPICSFFLQNRCRFGENCKFEHPRGGGGGGAQRNLFGGGAGAGGGGGGGNAGNNPLKWHAGQQTQGGQTGSQSTAMDMVNGLPKEMDAWEQTKMWPFSCLSVEKELPCLPEFHDISVEEIRLEAYQAQKSGGMQAFNQKLQGIGHEYQTKRNQLRHMSMELKQKLASFIDDARKKKANQAYSMSASTSSVFGSATAPQTGGLFGNTATSGGSTTGLFGQTGSGTGASTFGSTTGNAGGLFGKPAAQSSPFGTANTTFGNVNAPNSLFGTPQRTNATGGGLFGSQAQTPQAGGNSMFGQLAATPNQPAAGLFGQQPQATPSQGLFGNASATTPASGLFGKPATIGGIQPQNSVFGAFGNSNNATGAAATPASTGLFGKPAAGGMAGVSGGGGGGIFGQQMSSAVPTGLFGGPGQSQNLNPAGSGGGLFGTLNSNNNQPGLASAATAAGAGLFGKPAAALNVPTGLFGQTAQQPSAAGVVGGGGLFATPTVAASSAGTGLFGKGPPQVGINPNPSSSTSALGSGGLFGNTGMSNSPLSAGGGIGGLGSALPTVSGGSVSSSSSNSKHFSMMDELSPQDIEAFKANTFVLGKIPIKPPPRELVFDL